MLEGILTIAVTIFQTADQFNNLTVDLTDTQLKYGILTNLNNVGINFITHLVYNFFDSARLDAAITNQSFKSDAGYLTADWIKA